VPNIAIHTLEEQQTSLESTIMADTENMPDSSTVDDYYGVLEVSKSADAATIKARYKNLALLRHPDKNLDNPDATTEFQRVSSIPTQV
jgi:DnaJ-domain-containing protein 1